MFLIHIMVLFPTQKYVPFQNKWIEVSRYLIIKGSLDINVINQDKNCKNKCLLCLMPKFQYHYSPLIIERRF